MIIGCFGWLEVLVVSYPGMRNIKREMGWGRISKSQVSIGHIKFEMSVGCPGGDVRWMGERMEINISFKYHQYEDDI